MNETRAIRGIDLHLDVSGPRPARAQEAAIRAAILDGRLGALTRLPASRPLAADLGIARNTVAEVYAQLTAEGWLEARVGAGTWVRARAQQLQTVAGPVLTRQPLVDLAGGIPDASGFLARSGSRRCAG